MSGVNPQGCQVFSFKHPSPTELQHDFLWRTTRDLPERGRIGIFNRSYYEEVLIVRVHPEIYKAKRSRAPRITTRRSGMTGIVRSWIWRNTSTATAPASSNPSFTSPRKNSESVFWRASMNRERIGNSALQTSRKGNFGSST